MSSPLRSGHFHTRTGNVGVKPKVSFSGKKYSLIKINQSNEIRSISKGRTPNVKVCNGIPGTMWGI